MSRFLCLYDFANPQGVDDLLAGELPKPRLLQELQRWKVHQKNEEDRGHFQAVLKRRLGINGQKRSVRFLLPDHDFDRQQCVRQLSECFGKNLVEDVVIDGRRWTEDLYRHAPNLGSRLVGQFQRCDSVVSSLRRSKLRLLVGDEPAVLELERFRDCWLPRRLLLRFHDNSGLRFWRTVGAVERASFSCQNTLGK